MTKVKLPVLSERFVLKVIRRAQVEAATKVFGCEHCQHLGSDGDGPEYNGTWPVCNKHDALGFSPKFPFKVAPLSCFELDADAGAWAKLLWAHADMYPDMPTGIFALVRCADARGALRHGGVDRPLARLIHRAMYERIAWEDEDGDSYVSWRNFRGGAYRASERVSEKEGRDIWQATVSIDGAEFYNSTSPLNHHTSLEAAKRFAEIVMREAAIRRLLAEYPEVTA